MFCPRVMPQRLVFLTSDQQHLLEGIQVRLLAPDELPQVAQLLAEHHYLGSLKPVGERLCYAVTAAQGDWLGVLVFCAAARRLRPCDQWIGWSDAQCRRRLPLIVGNTRFLLLSHKTIPNLASKTLRRVLARLSDDWQARYGHPVLLVETFVVPAHFAGTLHTASGWTELGQTDGTGQHARDFYVRHDQPKRLFCRELGQKCPPELAGRTPPPPPRPPRPRSNSNFCARTASACRIIGAALAIIRSGPCWLSSPAPIWPPPRADRKISLPFPNASLSVSAGRWAFARSPPRENIPPPSQPTFCRLNAQVSTLEVERAVLAFPTPSARRPAVR